MNRDAVVYSPAKINIHLDIKHQRPDGYHDIVSLFHTVSLFDEITVSSLKNADNCSIRGDFDCSPKDNLIIQAAGAFLKLAGSDKTFEFNVKKSIPAGAGLGGGSGNAASVLLVLNELHGLPLSAGELHALGESLGSDIPFFLGGPSALVTGRGEKLKSLPPLSGYEAVLAVPELSISSGDAYKLFDREGRVNNDLDPEEVERVYRNVKPAEWSFFNSFWDPIRERYPELELAYGLLKEAEADFVSMSGSGSAVFGLFSSEKCAENGLKRLKQHFSRVWKIKLLAQAVASY